MRETGMNPMLFSNDTTITKQMAAELSDQYLPKRKRIATDVLCALFFLSGLFLLSARPSVGIQLLSISTGLAWIFPLTYAISRHKIKKSAEITRKAAFYDSFLTVTFRDGTIQRTYYTLIRRIVDYGAWITLVTKRERIVLSKSGFSEVDYPDALQFLKESTGIQNLRRGCRFPFRVIVAIILALFLAVTSFFPGIFPESAKKQAEELSSRVLAQYDRDYNNSSCDSFLCRRPGEYDEAFRLFSCSDMLKKQPPVLYAAYFENGKWAWDELASYDYNIIACDDGQITEYFVHDYVVLVLTGFEGMRLTDLSGNELLYDCDSEAKPLHAGLVILPIQEEVFEFYANDVLQKINLNT